MIDHSISRFDDDARCRLIDGHMAELRQRYPYQFAQEMLDFMLDPEPGWLAIISTLCRDVDALIPVEVRPQFQWTQIMEKFGTLRASWSLGPQFFDSLSSGGVLSGGLPRERPAAYEPIWAAIDQRIAAATAESAKTCGECGALGILRDLHELRTLCDRHADLV